VRATGGPFSSSTTAYFFAIQRVAADSVPRSSALLPGYPMDYGQVSPEKRFRFWILHCSFTQGLPGFWLHGSAGWCPCSSVHDPGRRSRRSPAGRGSGAAVRSPKVAVARFCPGWVARFQPGRLLSHDQVGVFVEHIQRHRSGSSRECSGGGNPQLAPHRRGRKGGLWPVPRSR